MHVWREGGREGGREWRREEGMGEGGREEGGREGGRISDTTILFYMQLRFIGDIKGQWGRRSLGRLPEESYAEYKSSPQMHSHPIL